MSKDIEILESEVGGDQESSPLLAAIVESLEEAIVSKDLSGKVTTWNRAASRLLGYGPSEMIGCSIDRLLPDVLGNRSALTQVLANLLGNAAKFVPRGVHPRIRIRGHLVKKGFVRINFEDNGIGIEPGAQKRLFQMFQRGHSGDAYEGTGIGLAIVRKAVDRMGGRVGVESKLEHGSTFWVELKAYEEKPSTR